MDNAPADKITVSIFFSDFPETIPAQEWPVALALAPLASAAAP